MREEDNLISASLKRGDLEIEEPPQPFLTVSNQKPLKTAKDNLFSNVVTSLKRGVNETKRGANEIKRGANEIILRPVGNSHPLNAP
jgi:hypothetical protein